LLCRAAHQCEQQQTSATARHERDEGPPDWNHWLILSWLYSNWDCTAKRVGAMVEFDMRDSMPHGGLQVVSGASLFRRNWVMNASPQSDCTQDLEDPPRDC